MYLYIFITWLLANLIHPVTFYFFMSNGRNLLGGNFAGLYFFIFLYSLFISSIGLLLSFLAINIISKLPFSNEGKFICWLVTAPLLIVVNLWLFFVLMGEGGSIELSNYELAVPATIALAVIILIRYKYFYKTMEALKTETKSNEL